MLVSQNQTRRTAEGEPAPTPGHGLAPESALGLLPSIALSSAQATSNLTAYPPFAAGIFSGGLIHTAVGKLGGLGSRRTKRSGVC
jgi:hypothetical protein